MVTTGEVNLMKNVADHINSTHIVVAQSCRTYQLSVVTITRACRMPEEVRISFVAGESGSFVADGDHG